MPYLDSTVTGLPLATRSYGDKCDLTSDNIKGAVFDEFMLAHLLGWIFKHCMLRDIRLSFAISFLFECMEYTFEFLQPNFVE